MGLTSKFTLAVVAGILVVHAANAALRVRREVRHLKDDIARDEKVIGASLAHAVERLWDAAGPEAAREMVQKASAMRSHVQVRWVWLDAPPGDSDGPVVSVESLMPLDQGRQAVVVVEGGAAAVHTYTPVSTPGGRPAAIEISDSLSDETAYVRQSVIWVVVATAILVALCGAVTWAVGQFFVGRPVQALVKQARRIGRGHLDERVVLAQHDEFGLLADELNRMCDGLSEARSRARDAADARLAAVDQLRHADRLTTVGTLAAGVAHELGTPLNVIKGHAQFIEKAPGSPLDARDNAAVISEQADRITAIVRRLLDFSRSTSGFRSRVDLLDIARQTLRMIAPLARKAKVETSLSSSSVSLWASVSLEEMQQVLANIALNALDAMPDGGVLSVEVAGAPGASGATPMRAVDRGYAAISFRDTGEGMAAKMKERVFEPFFTTKEVGAGTGLGLAVAYGIVQDHGGWIDVESAPGAGSTFTVNIPVVEERHE